MVSIKYNTLFNVVKIIHFIYIFLFFSYRGAAHNGCNLNYRIDPQPWKLPVFFHNLRGYDDHLTIKALKNSHGNVRVIPTNMEKYMAFSVGQLQFLDSFQFTMQSLDGLVKTLDEKVDFKYTQQCYPDDEQVYLITKKGIFSYDFFDDISKLYYTEFPTRENSLASLMIRNGRWKITFMLN